MKLKLSLFLAVVAVAATTVLTIAPAAAPAQPTPTATVTTTIGGVTYQLTNLSAAVVNNALQITGTATNLVTGQTGPFSLTGTLTGAQAGQTCQILHLELGPVDLDLLGLMVHLDKVVLDITAQSGPGNLLGNLLCGIAHLLDQNALSLNQVAMTLNRLFARLGLD